MSRADDLRRQADLVERIDQITAEYEQALDQYRADPSDTNKDAYRAAADVLQQARAADRAERDGLAVVADVRVEG